MVLLKVGKDLTYTIKLRSKHVIGTVAIAAKNHTPYCSVVFNITILTLFITYKQGVRQLKL